MVDVGSVVAANSAAWAFGVVSRDERAADVGFVDVLRLSDGETTPQNLVFVATSLGRGFSPSLDHGDLVYVVPVVIKIVTIKTCSYY